MNKFKDDSAFEKALIEQLNSKNLDEKSLRFISGKIVETYKAGFNPNDWHVKGQPPRLDALVVDGNVSVNDVNALASVLTLRDWTDINIFRKGIPFPDVYNVQITFEGRQ